MIGHTMAAGTNCTCLTFWHNSQFFEVCKKQPSNIVG
jgi:hypothetical protein